jgi:hypothetical protein
MRHWLNGNGCLGISGTAMQASIGTQGYKKGAKADVKARKCGKKS